MPTKWSKATVDNYRLTIDIIRGYLQDKYGQYDDANKTGNIFNVQPSGTGSFSFNVPGDKFSEEDKQGIYDRRYKDDP